LKNLVDAIGHVNEAGRFCLSTPQLNRFLFQVDIIPLKTGDPSVDLQVI
jgi:hypothetical protein